MTADPGTYLLHVIILVLILKNDSHIKEIVLPWITFRFNGKHSETDNKQ